ncbi:MAG TPA: hypothetical protein VFU19_09030 [Iamia sp.]|nr:hypothetical protein [Iamia sp.]
MDGHSHTRPRCGALVEDVATLRSRLAAGQTVPDTAAIAVFLVAPT